MQELWEVMQGLKTEDAILLKLIKTQPGRKDLEGVLEVATLIPLHGRGGGSGQLQCCLLIVVLIGMLSCAP